MVIFCTLVRNNTADPMSEDGENQTEYVLLTLVVRNRCTVAFVVISRYSGALANERCRYTVISVADWPYTVKWRTTPPACTSTSYTVLRTKGLRKKSESPSAPRDCA